MQIGEVGQLLVSLYVLGQAIPPGLHVRLNMQTGKREAKLMDDSARKEPTGSSSADYVTHGMTFFSIK